MLVWYERGDGRWEAPAASYRAETRWIEVGGGYAIQQLGGRPFDADYPEEGRRFSVSYRDNVLGDTVLGIRRTMGGAHVLAGSHYESLRHGDRCSNCSDLLFPFPPLSLLYTYF
jgi:hypothetical protein